MLSIGTSNGANKPFLALVVLGLGNLPSEYGIEIASYNSAGNKKAHLRSATDNQSNNAAKTPKRRLIGRDVLVSKKSNVPSAAPIHRITTSIHTMLCLFGFTNRVENKEKTNLRQHFAQIFCFHRGISSFLKLIIKFCSNQK